MSQERLFWDDIPVGHADRFGQYAVTAEEVVEFASKYDPQPFHLDADAAERSIFGGLCASGWHTCAMFMRMLVDHFSARGMASLGSPGVEQIQWRRPVFPGDVLHVKGEVVDKRASQSKPQMGSVTSTYRVYNQKDEMVMSLHTTGFFRRRPTEAASAEAG
ncbi:dehydratase [Rhodothalassium salexigens]|uniref:MaoC/PaaZ C-terminal domain-containing protein n=1 Tax=Rhodothalassium salexigens TaxID=1086 RepID=UPI0019116AE7|nr:dehydratase [Rhodothalassium salexigens]MBK5920792.1 dehydratase [Rhodothalassium salexigens]